MPREALPFIPSLPVEYDRLAAACLGNPATSADFVLLLAEALEEVAQQGEWHGERQATTAAMRELASELRRRAPRYA